MEGELDEVAQGDLQMVPMLEEFYGPFKECLELAKEAMPRVKVEEATDEVCEKCGEGMVIKTGRFGRFLACTNFPTCRTTKPVADEGTPADAQGQTPPAEETTDEICEKCGKPMEIRSGRFGRFIACSDYPTCKTSKPILNRVGVACPKCGGDVVQRRSRGKGRVFYGCSKYPECDYVSNQRPLPDPCPECGGLMVAVGSDGTKCTVCTWTGDIQAPEPATAG
jgi:DNA topoisomerase-1